MNTKRIKKFAAFRNTRGKIVGHLYTDHVYRKRVQKSKHLMLKHNAWRVDDRILTELINLSCKELRVLDEDNCSMACTAVAFSVRDESKWYLATCYNCKRKFDRLKCRKARHVYCSSKCAREKNMLVQWSLRRRQMRRAISKGMDNNATRQKIYKCTREKRTPMADSHKQKISDALAGKMPKNTMQKAHYGNIKAGWYKIGRRKIYFRSKWEANYALYLDWLKKHGEIKTWKFEARTFWFENIRRGCRSYLPDFEVTNNDGSVEYHEVKGHMDARSKTKIKRMAKYYPDVTLIVIDSAAYNDIHCKAPIMWY